MTALAAAAVAFVVQWAAQTVAFRVGSSTARALHERLGGHLADLPLGWFTPARQATVIDAGTTGVPQLMSYPALLLRPAITALVTPPAAALTLALLDWRFTVIVLAATAAAWAASRYSGRLARAVDARRHRTAAEATDRVLEYADRQPLIRTDQRPGDTEALDRALDEVRAAALRSAGAVIPGLVMFGVTLNALFAALVAAGAAWTGGAGLSVPVFVGILVVTARLTAIASAGADLAAAVRAAGLERTIAGLPDGLDGPAGPGGKRLSGGERQRVCVARALLKAAPLTVMDEATSALDPENARLVAAAARRLAAGGSVLLITHNLETVRRADQILVLDGGRIVQRGTHSELAAADGLYRRLVLGGADERHRRSTAATARPAPES